MDRSQKIQKIMPALFILSTLEGILALILVFQTPSMEKNAWFMGLSFQRLVTAGISAVPVLICAVLTLKIIFDKSFTVWAAGRFQAFLSTENRLQTLSITLIAILLTGIYLFVLLTSPSAIILGPLPSIFNRIQSMLAWFMLLCGQALGVLVWVHREKFPGLIWQWRSLKTGLIFLAFDLILAHWIILIFKIDTLISIPGWFWQFHDKPFTLNDLIFLPMLVLFAGVVAFVLRHPERTWINLIALILLGVLFQVGFGFIDGDGFESLRFKYASSSHAIYAQHASDKPDLVKTISEYDLRYGDNGFVQTKPPGMLTFYNLTQKASALFFNENTYDERVYGLTAFAAYVFPFISFLTLIPLFFLSRKLTGVYQAWLACIFYLSAPIIMLMPLFLDQVLFPLVFITTAWLMVGAFERQSILLAILGGISLYLAIFFSFSLVTLIPFAGALTLVFILQRQKSGFIGLLKILIGLALGFAILYGVFIVFLQYNPLTRFSEAMTVHYRDDFFNRFNVASQGSYLPDLGQRLGVLRVNIVSFAVWMGLPLFFLTLSGGLRVLIRLWKDRFNPQTGVLAAIFVTLAALLVSGEAAGEVARQWAFSLTFFALIAGGEIPVLFKKPNRWVWTLLAMQLLTMYLTFKFQDFRT